MLLLIIGFITLLIVMNIRKKKESKTTTLMRIFANYLQVVSTALAYDTNYPNSITQMFSAAEIIGSSSEAFVSIDCFIQNSNANAFMPNSRMFKTFLIILIPIALILIYSLVWMVLYFSSKRLFGDIKRNIVVSVIVILFMFYPTLTRAGLIAFECVKVGAGDYRAKMNLDFKCYSSEHIAWFMALGVPTTLIWGIGIPVGAMIFLLKYRNRLDTWEVQKYLLMLYQGLRHERYYWELINGTRKALLLCISSFLSTIAVSYRVLIATIVLVFILRLQQKFSPYKYRSFNYLEFYEILTGTFTIITTLIFEEKDKNTTLNFLCFLACK